MFSRWRLPFMLSATLSAACFSGLSAARAGTPGATSIPTSNPPATKPAAIEQSQIDAAMDRLRDRQQQRAENPEDKTNGPKPVAMQANPNRPLQAALEQIAFDLYPRDLVLSRKIELVKSYDKDIVLARQALRRREIRPSDVRELAEEQAALQSLSVEQFRQLLIDTDRRNEQRLGRYREAFGELNHAALTVVTILMKAGLVDSAQPLPDDPLSEELEMARGVRRVYYHFNLPSNDGPARRHNGYVEFQLAAAQGLWLPTWAELENGPIPLFDAEAFVPLQPYKIVYDGEHFVVAQVGPQKPLPLFSLLSPRNGVFVITSARPQRLASRDRP
ncbi:MAG: hypothetical protein H7Z14_04545 [Anaerolineae bacterium]|nr:hypothetical protein [Phycisphaerae bacterium]